MKIRLLPIMAIAALLPLASCSDDNKELPDENGSATALSKTFGDIAVQFTDNTVIPTYRALSENAARLVTDLVALQADKTDANVRKACDTFLAARAWWEMSEAFLFGPAGDFGIDPHIDSWPLDRTGLLDEMGNVAHIGAMGADDGDVWAGSHLGPELLGFHGIEYIIFADGTPKAATAIPDNELIYAIAVAGDLRNKCWQLELSWAGEENVSDEILAKVADELEWPYTVSGGSYRANMVDAGNAGSIYRTRAHAIEAIVDGCITIADEVGTMKIGKPYSGEDVNYIESPYSHKSITDFRDNIISIRNVYTGGIDGRRDESKSLHGLMAASNPALDRRVTQAIDGAIAKIEGMAAPFVLNFRDPSAKAASDACRELVDVLEEVKTEITRMSQSAI